MVKALIAIPLILLRMFLVVLPKALYRKVVGPPKYASPFLQENYGPISEELTVDNLEVLEGSIPKALRGIYVRNGPNPQFPTLGFHHWFDGDGMLHSIRFPGNGRPASYTNRYVKTKRYLAEKAAGRKLFPTIYDIIDPTNFVLTMLKFIAQVIAARGKRPDTLGKQGYSTANTAVEYHDKRLLALVESDVPHHVRLPDLETVGQYDYGGQLDHAFTAHPKVCPETGEMMFFGYRMDRAPYVQYNVVSKEGKLSPNVDIELPVPVMMHDFAITRNYSVFLDLPLNFRAERALLRGANPMAFEPNGAARVGILPRHAKKGSEMEWYPTPACFVYHTANAWEENDGKMIVLVACRSSGTRSLDLDWGRGGNGRKYKPHERARLYMWRIDRVAKVISEERYLDDTVGEFPTVNLRYLGLKTRYVYFACNEEEAATPTFNGLVKFDLATGEKKTLLFGETRRGGEASFVARDDAEGGEEDDGYLVTFVFDKATGLSECWVVDAKTLSANTVCRIKLPQRVPYGFHGKWVSHLQVEDQRTAW